MMTSFTTRLVELWPVLVLSQVAYWKVVLALEALWDRAEAFGGFSELFESLAYSSKSLRVVIRVAVAFLAASLIVYALVRKSIKVTRILFITQVIQIVLALAALASLVALTNFRDDWRAELILSQLNSSRTQLLILSSAKLLFGWSLIVYSRDLQGQPRNAWGRLLRPDEVIVEEMESMDEKAFQEWSQEGYIKLKASDDIV